MTAKTINLTLPALRGRLTQMAAPALLAVAVLAPLQLPPTDNYNLSIMFVYATAILGLTVLTGASGQASLAHGTFLGIGAYATTIATVNWGVPLWIAGLVAVATTVIIGFAVGLLCSRLNGLYLALITIAVTIVFAPLIKRFADQTGGSGGLVMLQPQPPSGSSLASDQFLYFIALALLVVAWFLTRGVLTMGHGRALNSCQDDPLAAIAMGVNVPLYRAVAFAWAGALAGLAGFGYAVVVGFVSPESFPLLLSVALLAGLVVGGAGSLWGALFGAAYVQFVPQYTSQVSESAAGVVYGISLVLVILLVPGGLVSLWSRLAGFRRRTS